MKIRIIWGIVILAVLAAIGTAIFCVTNQASVFTGDRVKNPDSYTMKFEEMNQEDGHQLTLKEGDILLVDFAITKGNVDLSIGMEGEKAIYTGNKINQGTFELTIPKDGIYQITVKAEHAAGTIYIYTESR